MKLRDCDYWTCRFYGQIIGTPRYANSPKWFRRSHRRNYKKIHSRNHLMYVRLRKDGPNNGMMHQRGYQILHNGRKP